MPGINNLGNTCYLNATIQCLFHIEEIQNFLLNKKLIDSINTKSLKISLFVELKKFFEDYVNSNTAVTPIRFKRALGYVNNLFNNCNQHDSQEFLIFLFDQLSTELSRNVVMNIKCNNNINEYKMVYNKVQHTKDNQILHNKNS